MSCKRLVVILAIFIVCFLEIVTSVRQEKNLADLIKAGSGTDYQNESNFNLKKL